MSLVGRDWGYEVGVGRVLGRLSLRPLAGGPGSADGSPIPGPPGQFPSRRLWEAGIQMWTASLSMPGASPAALNSSSFPETEVVSHELNYCRLAWGLVSGSMTLTGPHHSLLICTTGFSSMLPHTTQECTLCRPNNPYDLPQRTLCSRWRFL